MKKLGLLFAVIGLLFFVSPPPLMTHAALPAPTSWDYAYKYNATADEFQFTDYNETFTNTPVYTRTADSTYFNYTYTGTALGNLPFEVTLTFNRSNTTWKTYGGGYTSDDTKIGSNNLVSSITEKFYISINNLTNDDYYIYLDTSSTEASTKNYLKLNNLYFAGWYDSNFRTFPAYNTYYNYLYLPAKTSIIFGTIATSNKQYLDSFYIKNLGLSASYTAGLNEGLDNLDNAYAQGYADALTEVNDMAVAGSLSTIMIVGLGLLLMLFGMIRRIPLLNLISTAAWIYYAVIAGDTGLTILGISLVIFNVFYTINMIREGD